MHENLPDLRMQVDTIIRKTFVADDDRTVQVERLTCPVCGNVFDAAYLNGLIAGYEGDHHYETMMYHGRTVEHCGCIPFFDIPEWFDTGMPPNK